MLNKTYVNVYKHSRLLMRIFLWTGVAMFIAGISLFLIDYIFTDTDKPGAFTWNYLALAFQGLIAWAVGYKTLANEKYFVEWDDEQIRWWLPRRNNPETINIKDIQSVEIQNLQVVVGLKQEQKSFNLKFFFFPERKMIMEKFETIRQSLNS